MEDAKSKIEDEVNDIIKDSDKFLVKVDVAKNKKVIVFVDADSGITISDCKSISRQLYKRIVEDSIFEDGEFALEVSSPGLDYPLQNLRQYQKNIGRLLEVKTKDEKVVEGRLKEITEDNITLEIKEKKGTKMQSIPLEEIEKSTIQPEFK